MYFSRLNYKHQKMYHKIVEHIVATLALGSQAKQGFARVRAKKEAQKSHLMFLGV